MKKLGVRFDGAKRDYGQSSRRFTIPASPSDGETVVILEFMGVFGVSEARLGFEVFSSDRAGCPFRGAKRDYGQSSRRFVGRGDGGEGSKNIASPLVNTSWTL